METLPLVITSFRVSVLGTTTHYKQKCKHYGLRWDVLELCLKLPLAVLYTYNNGGSRLRPFCALVLSLVPVRGGNDETICDNHDFSLAYRWSIQCFLGS